MSLDGKRLLRMLTQRELMERVEETKFATVRQATARREHALAANQQRRVELYTMGGPEVGSVDPAAERGRSAYTVRVGREIATSRNALEAGRRQEEIQRLQLLESRKDRMAIEALIERLRQQRHVKQRRRAARVADEWSARDWFAVRTEMEGDA
jgi:flagellar export protein FliJ